VSKDFLPTQGDKELSCEDLQLKKALQGIISTVLLVPKSPFLDVRANSVKRVASAVGEGSVVISDVHRYLAACRDNFEAAPDSTLPALRNASAANR
jgi:hypothetical protein